MNTAKQRERYWELALPRYDYAIKKNIVHVRLMSAIWPQNVKALVKRKLCKKTDCLAATRHALLNRRVGI